MKVLSLNREQAFTLIELMVVIAIIGLLAATLLPQVNNLVDRAKATTVMSVYNTMRTACIAHYNDTAIYAYELNVNYSGAGNHQLSMSQSYGGWDGPYLEPFGYAINPTKGWPAIGYTLGLWNLDSGYDLDRDGAAERTGPGNFLHFEQFPSRLAQLVDERMDGSGPGAWDTRGKVEWRSAWGGTIQIYITGG